MSNFNVGDTVVFMPVNPHSWAARTGAKATVRFVEGDDVNVAWIRDDKSRHQMDGNYSQKDFKVFVEGSEDALFLTLKETVEALRDAGWEVSGTVVKKTGFDL